MGSEMVFQQHSNIQVQKIAIGISGQTLPEAPKTTSLAFLCYTNPKSKCEGLNSYSLMVGYLKDH